MLSFEVMIKSHPSCFWEQSIADCRVFSFAFKTKLLLLWCVKPNLIIAMLSDISPNVHTAAFLLSSSSSSSAFCEQGVCQSLWHCTGSSCSWGKSYSTNDFKLLLAVEIELLIGSFFTLISKAWINEWSWVLQHYLRLRMFQEKKKDDS